MRQSTDNTPITAQYVVIGLGLTGQSCITYLTQQNASFFAIDTRQYPPNLNHIQQHYPHIQIYTGSHVLQYIHHANIAIISPGLSWNTPIMQYIKKNNKPYITDLDLFSKHITVPLIGITGSNGKSTVTAWITWISHRLGLSVAAGGNIGTPVLHFLMRPKQDVYCLELSSFQLDKAKSIPLQYAVFLNISPDHLDEHGSFKAYYHAKQRIFDACQTAIFNENDIATRPQTQSCHRIAFSSNRPKNETQLGIQYHQQIAWITQGSTQLVSAKELKVRGWHNLENAIAVLTIGLQMGFNIQAMIPALKSFPGLPHRCQWVAKKSQVDWFNDSKATNEDAAIQSIKSLATPHHKTLILIAGGQSKGAHFKKLAQMIQKHVKHVILFGENARDIEMAVKDIIPSIQMTSTLEQAVQCAARYAKPHERVVLSPACSSLDMFRNYEERGNQFISYVKALK
ncbi:MAG: UDP-N-acetylmuramoyl-L-alanine--D-glutamate ligase [Endozoicomonadaceae bacterium]|nr:UDP-N-acetylmuramoyl-L-alanine--D-glutamate ligase [Endozoicomonadaceae bacterium]